MCTSSRLIAALGVCSRGISVRTLYSTTPDNRYLLASLSTSELVIWSIIDNMEVQTIPLEQQIVAMALTPDGGYLLTAYSNSN